MNNEQTEQLIITACRVEDDDRMEFLPAFFGESLMLRGEGLVYSWMRRLSEDYQGGLWQFYRLSNGGFYMAPAYSHAWRSLNNIHADHVITSMPITQ